MKQGRGVTDLSKPPPTTSLLRHFAYSVAVTHPIKVTLFLIKQNIAQSSNETHNSLDVFWSRDYKYTLPD